MGALEIIRPDGERTTFHVDGSTSKDTIQIDWCDKCEKWKPLHSAAYEKQDGMKTIWFCGECK